MTRGLADSVLMPLGSDLQGQSTASGCLGTALLPAVFPLLAVPQLGTCAFAVGPRPLMLGFKVNFTFTKRVLFLLLFL